MKTSGLVLLLFFLSVLTPLAAEQAARPPIIDMHVHTPLAEGAGEIRRQRLELFDRFNVEKAVLIGNPQYLSDWVNEDPERFIPAIVMPCPGGADAFGRGRCFPGDSDLPDLDWLRGEIEAGRIQLLGEVIAQLFGMAPDDPALDPYFALAVEMDVPVGLHMGFAPPWTVADGPVYGQLPDYRVAAGDPLKLEEVLSRHRNLRLYVMHAGWPMIDRMLGILYHHPNVYVELGYFQTILEREEYYAYLQRLVDAGYGDRIMFGSDGGLDELEEGVRAIMEAPFLTESQQRDILYNNAATFLRLPGYEGGR